MLPQKKHMTNPNLTVAPDAVVCTEATIEGQVTIGAKCIVHPKACIIAKDGPIIIGEGNLIEERSKIVNRNKEGVEGKSTLQIGDYNVFEVSSEFYGKSMGNNNVLEIKSRVGPFTTISNSCVIGACCNINADETLPNSTVICGSQYLRRTNNDKPQLQAQQIDFLKKILPNYHHLVKSKKAG